MSRIKISSDTIKYISLFQAITKTTVKDCIESENSFLFIVNPGQISRAIGKNAENVRQIERALNRKIKIVEFNPNASEFVGKLIYPNKAKGVTQEDKKIIITPLDSQTRGRIIGKNASKLREYEGIVKRYFDIDELRVI